MAYSIDYIYNLLSYLEKWVRGKVSDIIFELDVAWMQIDDIYDLISNLSKKFTVFKSEVQDIIRVEISKIEFPEIDIDFTEIYEYIFNKVGDIKDDIGLLDNSFDALIDSTGNAISKAYNRIDTLDDRIDNLKENIKEDIQDMFIEIIENVMEQEKK